MKPSLTLNPSPCERLIRQEIERTGPLNFSTFVDLALYHPVHGYYNQPAVRRGRAGDYFTSLQVSALFPHIFADAILEMKEALGSEQFSLIEVGSGSGEFLEEALKYLSEIQASGQVNLKGMKVWAVERSRPARDLLVKRLSRFPRCQVVASMDDIEWTGTLEGCIFSNEFFDALPFHRRRYRDGMWKEIVVDVADGQLTEKESEGEPALESAVTDGHEIESRPQIPGIYKEWSAWLARGFVVTVDYGHPRESFLSPSRANGTFMCYRQHAAERKPFQHIGEQDITAHVDFTQLVEAGRSAGFDPALFCSQGIFLSHAGQKHIESYLAFSPDAEKRKRAAVVQQLIHPDAMGETFWTLIQSKGLSLPDSLARIPNRLRRLI